MEKQIKLNFEQLDLIQKALFNYADKIIQLSTNSMTIDFGFREVLDEKLQQVWDLNKIISDSPLIINENTEIDINEKEKS